MKLSTIVSRIKMDLKTFGVIKTVYGVLVEGVNLLIHCRITVAMKLEDVNPKFLESDDPLEWRFFNEAELLEFAKGPENIMPESFVRSAVEKGDECYGALDGETLACHGWYSNSPTELQPGMDFNFDPQYTYMYHGYTHPKYRGKRLHAIGMNRALQAFLARGSKGLVSCVDSHNYKSLQSVYRLGYQKVGYMYALMLGGFLLSFSSRGCRPYGVVLAKPRETKQLVCAM